MLSLPSAAPGKVQGAEGRVHNYSTSQTSVWKVRPEMPEQAWS